VHHRGFANAGIAGYKHQLRAAVDHDTVERREQCLYLALSTVKLLRDQQPVRYIVSTERERVDPSK